MNMNPVRVLGEYRHHPHTRAQLACLRTLSCGIPSLVKSCDDAEAAFDAEDKDNAAAHRFILWLREFCRRCWGEIP